MKSRYNFLVIMLAFFSIGTSSCKKNLAELNVNPNRPEVVDPEYLLNTAILNTMNYYGGDMRRRALSHYSNYVSVGGGQYERYWQIAASTTDYWRIPYVTCLQPVHQIQLNFGGQPAYNNRVAIAKILECYIYSNMVAIWGSIPRSQALNGDNHAAYDKEEDIYYSLMNDLKAAAAAINLSGDTYKATSDAIYAGSLIKWKKFANTLRLRLAMRISNPAPNGNPTVAKQVASEVLADEANTILNQGETARSFWGTTSQTWSFFYNYNVFNATSNATSLNVVSESLVQHMLPYNDPRLKIYAKPATQGPNVGKYWGQPKTTSLPTGFSMPNNPHANRAQLDYSQVGDYFAKPDAEYVFLSYEEACFLKAEAALKGWGGSKTADLYYVEGITASMTKYNLPQTEINAYLAQPGVKWNTKVDTTGRGSQFTDYIGITTSAILTFDPFRQIVMQEWLAGFYNAFDAWTLIRRTQVLEFPPHFNPDGSEGGTVGYAYVPQRLLYPDIEYNVNKDEVTKALTYLNGPDAMKTKLWFALPTKRNPYLPQ
ncbi:MAG: hypothetical protein JWN76_207 [Chitinophagaceae bacterium]|nr:hypothetical protein [Chitinophagaceae bacterium]